MKKNEISYEEKRQSIMHFFAHHLQHETVTEEMMEYARKVKGDTNLYYDYISANYPVDLKMIKKLILKEKRDKELAKAIFGR